MVGAVMMMGFAVHGVEAQEAVAGQDEGSAQVLKKESVDQPAGAAGDAQENVKIVCMKPIVRVFKIEKSTGSMSPEQIVGLHNSCISDDMAKSIQDEVNNALTSAQDGKDGEMPVVKLPSLKLKVVDGKIVAEGSDNTIVSAEPVVKVITLAGAEAAATSADIAKTVSAAVKALSIDENVAQQMQKAVEEALKQSEEQAAAEKKNLVKIK